MSAVNTTIVNTSIVFSRTLRCLLVERGGNSRGGEVLEGSAINSGGDATLGMRGSWRMHFNLYEIFLGSKNRDLWVSGDSRRNFSSRATLGLGVALGMRGSFGF